MIQKREQVATTMKATFGVTDTTCVRYEPPSCTSYLLFLYENEPTTYELAINLFLIAVERWLRQQQPCFIHSYTTVVVSIVLRKCSHQISFSVSHKQINTTSTQCDHHYVRQGRYVMPGVCQFICLLLAEIRLVGWSFAFVCLFVCLSVSSTDILVDNC